MKSTRKTPWRASKRAIALGLDGVELDVFLTKDKQLVVFHDIETERLTGCRGRARTLFSQDSKRLGERLSDAQQLTYIERLTAQGIDYFITDDPVRLQAILE